MSVQLHHGDCLEFMRTLPAGSVDAVVTDLPYGTTRCAWDSIIPLAPMWECVDHVLKPNGVFVTTASQPFTSIIITSKLDWFKHEWIWQKNKHSNFLNGKREPLKQHEEVVVFCKGSPIYNPIRETRIDQERARYPYRERSGKREIVGAFAVGERVTNEHGRLPSSVKKFSVSRGLHPTQKPVALVSYFVQTYSNPDWIILDIAMGSGTTGVACVQTGRNFIGCEIDAGYFEIAQRRIALAQQSPMLPGINEPAPAPEQLSLV